ncbi:MAG: glycosyl transferase, partial [Eubacteriales bacterium]
MKLTYEKSRDPHLTAEAKIKNVFSLSEKDGILDAIFLGADMHGAVAFLGLPFKAPICRRLLSFPEICEFIDNSGYESYLFTFSGDDIALRTEDGETEIPEIIKKYVLHAYSDMVCARGELGKDGEHIIDLKMPRVGTHFDINLLLGCRADFEEPLLTTPKASLDAFGRGAFRSAANTNVTSSRFDLIPEDSGEPANRQFYIFEDGAQIFYSANAEENVEDAFCVHAQNHTMITYQTKCGLIIRRTIFILPYEEGMPDAVEAQRIEIRNISNRKRKLKLVTTGMFALCSPESMTNDILYASITYEGAVAKKNGRALAVCPIPNPGYLKKNRRFATMFCDGEPFDDYTENYIDFIGRGTLEHPENGAHLSSAHTRKTVPFFALGKTLLLETREAKKIDCYTGIVSGKGDISELFDEKFSAFEEKYSDPSAFDEAFGKMREFYTTYSSYINISTGDALFDSYVNKNLPFQVLYQSFVSRSFAWTQKSAREIGFREIQDVYASLYYMNAMGKSDLARSLISKWAGNVYKMGYANHNFFYSGKEPGFCSDDALWLTQAVYRYV